MDFLRRNFEVAQKQAQEAAARAKVLAQDVSSKTQVLAQQAGENAKIFAEQMSVKTRELAEEAKTRAKNFSTEDAREALRKLGIDESVDSAKNSLEPPGKQDLKSFGITEEFKIFLRGLTYSTFRDFGNEDFEDVGFVVEENGAKRLNKWQEIHAKYVLLTVKELEDLRYVLCPRRMSEERFWMIYFSLAHKHLPENCVTGQLPKPQQKESKMPSRTPSETQIGEEYTFVQPYGQQDSSDDPVTSFKDTDIDGDTSQVEGVTEDLENDEDLEAYLENVLKEGGEEGTDSGLEDFEDFDEYMEQLDAGEDANSEQENKDGSAKAGGSKSSSGGKV